MNPFAFHSIPYPEPVYFPAWAISLMAFLYAVEYVMRFARMKGKNYFYLGKALARFYLAAAYMAFYIVDGLTENAWHYIARAGVFLFLATDLMYIAIEHYQRWQGDERRNCWFNWRGKIF